MRLSKRLKTIALLIPKKELVIDIGCDHALLDIYLSLYNENICIASDISEKALLMAKKNITKYHLEDKIKVIKSDGTSSINIDKNYNLVIAGMGTISILNIIKNSNYKYINSLIIQSNNDLYNLRREINDIGFIIDDEVVIKDKNIYYVIIKFIKGKKVYDNKELMFGPILLKKKDNMTNNYFDYIYNKNLKIINQIKNSSEKEKFIEQNNWIINR